MSASRPTMVRVGGLILLLSFGLCGCASIPLQVVSPDGKAVTTIELHPWLREHPLSAGQTIRVDELGRSDSASFHIVQIRTKEPPHVHRTHDLVAVVKQGHGTLFLGSQQLHLEPGSLVNIPHGVVHAFVNESRDPAVAFVVFSPPFDGTDTVPVQNAH